MIFNHFIATILMVASANFVFSQTGNAPSYYDKKFSPEQLKLDLFQLRTVLENVHPGLYRFESKETWDARFDSLSVTLDKPMTDIEYYRVLIKLISQVRCGHTNIGVSRAYHQKIFSVSNHFPFMVRIVDQKLYTYHNLSDENNIPDGSLIISINGQSSEDLINLFYPAIRADGYIETARHQKLGKYFSYFYATLIGYPEVFTIEHLAPGKKQVKEVTVRAKPDMEKGSLHWERYDSKLPQTDLMSSPLASRINRKENYAILKIDRFYTRGDEPDDLFETFYDSLFTQLSKQNIRNLILDVRGNGGGIDDLSSLLYSYLVDEPFTWYQSMHVKNLNFDAYTSGYTYNKYQYAQDEAGDIWVTNGDFLLLPHHTSSPTYSGDVYVLVDGLTFSAGSIFAAYVKSSGRGKIIGEESGGFSNAVTGGRSVSFRLSYTDILFSIPPLQTSFALTSLNEDRGVLPDHFVSPSIMDLVENKDPVMDFAIKKAKNSHH